jgi:hypothetical protein
MFGIDDWIVQFSDGTTVALIALVAILLGLRHATDPDHLAAVTTLVATGRERSSSAARRLGFAWGLGHATTLFLFGLPIVLFNAYLPGPVQEGAEASVGVVIVALAVWLLVRWQRGAFRTHSHPHNRARSPLQAFGIGLVHGMGGSAGVGVLLLAAINDHVLAVIALGLFAAFTAVSMMLVSAGFGATLASRPLQMSFDRLAPVLGMSSLAFGVWYMLGALSVAPYFF